MTKWYTRINLKPAACLSTNNITDLLQLTRKEKEMRLLCLESLHKFGEWKKSHVHYATFRLKMIYTIKGMIVKKQVRDAIFFYKMVKIVRIHHFNHYLYRLATKAYAYGGGR